MDEETKKYLKNWNTKTKRPKNLTKNPKEPKKLDSKTKSVVTSK